MRLRPLCMVGDRIVVTELAHRGGWQARGGNPPRRVSATGDSLTWMPRVTDVVHAALRVGAADTVTTRCGRTSMQVPRPARLLAAIAAAGLFTLGLSAPAQG